MHAHVGRLSPDGPHGANIPCGSVGSPSWCVGVTRGRRQRLTEGWPGVGRERERAKGDYLRVVPRNRARQGCLFAARRLDRCETFNVIYVSFVFHVIETPSVWNQPLRVVRAYAVGSFLPKLSTLPADEIRETRAKSRSIICCTLPAVRIAASRCLWLSGRALHDTSRARR